MVTVEKLYRVPMVMRKMKVFCLGKMGLLLLLIFIVGCGASQGDAPSTPIIRIDFSDDTSWEAMKYEINKSSFYMQSASVHYVSDKYNESLLPGELVAKYKSNQKIDDIYIYDSQSTKDGSILIIALDPIVDCPNSIRITPEKLAMYDVNSSLGNMDFIDFAQSIDSDGIFREFSEQ